MVLGLIWFFISYVSCWGNLGIIFLILRETLALSSMATSQSGCSWWIGNIQDSHFLKRSKSLAVKTKSLWWFLRTLHSPLISFFLLHILDLVLFLLCLTDFAFGNFPSKLPVNETLFLFWLGWQSSSNVDLGLVQLLFSFSLVANWWGGKSWRPRLFINERLVVPLVAPLSRHYGSSSSERLEGFSLFKVQICLNFFILLPRRLLFERQWVGWVVRCRLHEVPADVLCCASF